MPITEEKQNDAETLFYNRQSFVKFNQFKIDRTLRTLSEIDRLIFTTVPRLLHVNQEGLPGFVNDKNVPCGIMNFTISTAFTIINIMISVSGRMIRAPKPYLSLVHTPRDYSGFV